MSAYIGRSAFRILWWGLNREMAEIVTVESLKRLRRIRRVEMESYVVECPECETEIEVEGGCCKKIKCGTCGLIIQTCG